MSDPTVIAAVTRTLAHLIQDSINRAGGEIARAQVTTRRPTTPDAMPAPQVNLFLFHAQPNPNLRNDDLPTFEGGRLVRRPTVALDLFYLVSFSGAEDAHKLEPQTLMGVVSSALHAHPILTPLDIVQAGESFAIPAGSLAALNEVVLSPVPLSIEDMSRLWVTFPSVPYQLSVCYRATAVLISEKVAVDPPLPITRVSAPAKAMPSGAPVILDVAPPPQGWAAGDHPVYGETILIRGRGLAGGQVTLGGAALPVASDGDDTQLAAQLTGAELRAGLRPLRVVRDGAGSLPCMVAMGPAISVVKVEAKTRRGAFSGKVELDVHPRLRTDQAAQLLLNPTGLPPRMLGQARGYGIDWYPPLWRNPEKITIALQDIQPGEYLVRLAVDGVESALQLDADGSFSGPIISLEPS